ncbi:TadG family pilus assembly protein [Bordetella sp. LUAb4]|uniref:TadG family pilus assembly protein n=1 Tax=Bordetella sp. LUAb4 TaxID=2843195 RepID=UPI001E40F48C|nr:TadG family pilus assembly protein [Bordetella sp. LUAb4]
MSRARHPRLNRHRQRGSILVPAAVGLLVMVILLGGAQLGYLFYTLRELQKAADLAALTGAQVLSSGTALNCSTATTAAVQAGQANFSGLAAADIAATCWHWDPVKNTTDPRHLAPLQGNQRYNAIRVTMSRNVASLIPFMGSKAINVQSVAARPGAPVAAFSVGSTLITTRQQPGTLVNLLSAVGLNVNPTALVGYDAGLASVQITPAGLLNQLGINVSTDVTVGQLNSLLAANTVSLNNLLDAVAVVGGQSGLLAANVTLVNTIKTQLGLSSLNVTLGSNTAGRGSSLFAQITAPDGAAALATQINALDLIAAAVGVATGGHAVQGGAPVSIAGLVTITPAFSVIEPAQIAIGGVGATAYTGQVRVFLQVTIPTIKLLGGVLAFGVDLPIVMDLVTGQGTLTDLCTTQDSAGRDLATIAVTTSVLDTCIGDLTQATAFSSTQRCSVGLRNKQLLTLKVAGIDMGVNNKITLNPFVNGPMSTTLYAGQKATVAMTSLPLGTAVSNVSNAVLTALLGGSAQTGAGTQPAAVGTALATDLWNKARQANTCNPNASGADGYNCRNALWQAAVKLSQNASNNLGGYISGQPNAGLLTGVGNLLNGLVNTLGSVLSGIVGALLPTNNCATASLLGGYGGSESGCIGEIAKSYANTPNAGTNLSNVLLGILGPLFTMLQPVLNGIGDAVLGLINNTIGLNLNSVDVKLMSLQCNGKGVQLVF